jgi:hypothetical protein
VSEVEKKRLELIEKIPSDIPGIRCMRGRHQVLGKGVEVRIAETPGREGAAAPFFQEMLELSYLDHPCFPPVLERGLHQNRYYYAVPLRSHDPLSEAITKASLTTRERGAVIWALANSLSAMHRGGIVPPPPDARELHWDRETETLRIRHPRLRASKTNAFLDLLPQKWQGATPKDNVHQWAAFSYWLLTQGKAPFEGDEPVSLRKRIKTVHPDLVELIDVCLYGEQDEQPATGPELLALLRLIPDVLPPPSAPPKRKKVGSDPRFSELNVRKSLENLRQRGAIPRTPRTQDSPVEKFRERFQNLSLPSLGTFGSEQKKLLLGVGLVMLLGILLLLFSGEEDAPPVKVGATDLSHLKMSAEDLRKDPYLARLVAIHSVTPEEFPRVWKLVRTLALQSRLPETLRDEKRILLMHSTFQSDPDQACGDLEHLLEELRSLIEETGDE